MGMTLVYPEISSNKGKFAPQQFPVVLSLEVTHHPIIRDDQRTQQAKSLAKHMDVVAESRKLIREGQTISWDEYAKST